MAKYEIVDTEFYHADGGTWLTICEVEFHLSIEECYDPEDIEEAKQLGDDLPDWHFTQFVVVGSGYLNVYDRKPFSDDQEVQPKPIESFKLDDYEPTYLMENNPGLDLWDYIDPFWFCAKGQSGLVVHENNLIYNTCFWQHKFNMNKTGHC